MEFDFSQMSDAELESRAAAIITESEAEGADLEALTAEARALASERETRAAEQRRVEQRQAIADGLGTVIRNIEEEIKMSEQRTYNAESPEFRSAWLKTLAVCQNQPIFGEMTAEEREAFTVTTQNTPGAVPKDIANRVVELVESMAPMYDDATKSEMARGFELLRHKAIKAGDAKGVAEGTANDDEQDEFDSLPLGGIELKKHIVISRKMQFQSIDAFADWVVQHISERIAVAREKVIIARLNNTAPAGGSAVANAGIASGNVKTDLPYTDASIRSIFALIKGHGGRAVYANSNTIWNGLASIEDGHGNKLFTPNSMVDPVVQGRIYGAAVKLDANLADDEAYFGVSRKLLANDFIPTEITPSMEAKTGANIVLGYALFDAGLENPESFVKATFTHATAAAAN